MTFRSGGGPPAGSKPFLPGNPGRPVGIRNRLTNSLLKALADDFEEHGPAVIKIVRTEKPDVYLRTVASLVPREFMVADAKLGDLSEEELMSLLATVREMRNQAAQPRAGDHEDQNNDSGSIH